MNKLKRYDKQPIEIIELKKEEVKKVIDDMGGPVKVAALLKLNYSSAVSNWIARGKIPRPSQSLLQFLRPDIFKKLKRK